VTLSDSTASAVSTFWYSIITGQRATCIGCGSVAQLIGKDINQIIFIDIHDNVTDFLCSARASVGINSLILLTKAAASTEPAKFPSKGSLIDLVRFFKIDVQILVLFCDFEIFLVLALALFSDFEFQAQRSA
jgi:hypothetical protein